MIYLLFLLSLPIGEAVAGDAFYYTIHSDSYRQAGQANRQVKYLQGKGQEAFYERVDLTGKGRWYRVYMGKYENENEARKAADNGKQGGIVNSFSIMRLRATTGVAVGGMDKKIKRQKISAAKSLASESFPAVLPFNYKQQKTAPIGDINTAMTDSKGNKETHAKDLQMERPVPVPPVISDGKGQGHAKAMSEEEGLLDQAMQEFQAKRYEKASEQYKAILNRPGLSEALRDKALRPAADANYFLGLKGDMQYLLTAIDQYKMILQHSPGPLQENDLILYRMAIGYEKLRFYYESVAVLERLILAYPESTYLPEAMFRIGDLLHQTAKYNRAIERLLAYVKKYPEGKYAKLASVIIADCYYLMRNGSFASQWYEDVGKKWPDLTDLPHALLINMGNHYFEVGKFGLSLQLYSLFVNVFPQDEFSKKAFSMMARSLERMGETALALHMYRIFIEKYPDSKEAEAFKLSMANLGVSNPGAKFPIRVMAVNDYLEPMQSYDRLMSKNPEAEQAAAILLGKGNALVTYGLIQEGVDAYLELLSRFPQSSSVSEGLKKMNLSARSLISACWAKGDYLAVASVYFKGAGKGLTLTEDFDMASKIGESLSITGLYEDAARVYATMRKTFKDKDDKITLALASIDIAKGRHAEAEEKLEVLLKKVTKGDHELLKEVKTVYANLFLKTGRFARANLLYEDVLTAGGESPGMVYHNYSRSLQAVNMHKRAIAHSLKALKDHEQHPEKYTEGLLADIYTGLGDAYYGEQSYQEGIGAYRQALTHVKDLNVRAWLLTAIGNGYAGLGVFSEAEKSFTQLKEKAEGTFWPKVADYFIAKSSDREKYGTRSE